MKSVTAKIVGKLAGLAVAVAAAGGGLAWWQGRIGESQRVIADLERQNEYLKNVAERLDAERRTAKVVVTDQWRDAGGRLNTELLFFEVGRDGDELPPRQFTVVGEQVHVDAKVVAFDNDFVREGDPLRGRAILLWDKIYGSAVAPEEGQPLDPVGQPPRLYDGAAEGAAARNDDAARAEFEADLWADFWRLAGDADYAESKGVRVAQGQGLYGIFSPDKVYELSLGNDGRPSLYARDMDTLYRELLRAIQPHGAESTAASSEGE